MIFEQLESRRLMSGSLSAVQQNGVLYVQGTSGPDQIQIFQTSPGAVVVAFGPGGSQGIYPFTGVTAIAVNANSGNDTLNINDLADIDASVSLGNGNDSITLDSTGGSIVVDGGNGIDNINLAVVNACLVVATGGNEGDTITVNATDTGAVFIDGGNGNDSIEFSGFNSSAVIYAGNGNDQVSVPLFFSIDGTDKLIVYGGNGTDSSIVSNVGGQVFVACDVEIQTLQ